MGRRELVLATVMALLLRVFVVLVLFPWNVPGWGGEMASVAVSLSTGHGFGSPYGALTGPTAIVTPGYPWLETLVFHVWGVYTLSAEVVLVTINIVVSALTTIPLSRLAARLAHPSAARVATWTWTLLPVTGYTSAFYVWDTAILTAAIVITVTWLLDLRAWGSFGVWLGLAALVDPALLAPSAVTMLIVAGRAWVKPALALGIIALVTAPWLIRNSVTFGHPTYLRDNADAELWYATQELAPPSRLSPNRNPAELVRYRTIGEAAYMAQAGEQARAAIRADPMRFARRAVHAWLAFWFGGADVPTLGWDYNRFGLIKRLLYGGLTVLAFVGLVTLTRRSWQTGVILASFLAVYGLPYAFVLIEARYRSPLEPVLLALAATCLPAGARATQSKPHPVIETPAKPE